MMQICTTYSKQGGIIPFGKFQGIETALDKAAVHHEEETETHLPGHPRVSLREGLYEFLEKEFISDDLDRIAPRLWMMSLQSPCNISPLHRQRVKGRRIIVTEDPKLHLVWFYDRIFIKPLPQYLCSHAFWEKYMDPSSDSLGSRCPDIRAAAMGYLKTWYYLIRHESDFRIAKEPELQLLPQRMDWEGFCRFSENFNAIPKSDVSMRYQYGEIRLTRLNLYSKLFLRRRIYQRMYGQYGDYFGRFYGPLFFIFAVLSILLNCMQLSMAVEQVDYSERPNYPTIFWWCGIVGAISVVVVSCFLITLLIIKLCTEWVRALSDRLFVRQPPRFRDCHEPAA